MAALSGSGRPDDAPECHAEGCHRLGVIAQTVTTREGTSWFYWCLTHDPEDPEG